MSAIRVTAVLTHPVQYYAPWFRRVASHHPDIDLTVLYAIDPTPEQQGVGFDRPLRWDVPLLDGYRHRFVRAARPGDDLSSAHFRGLDVPEITAALDETRPEVALIPGWSSVTLVRALLHCRRRGVPTLYRGDNHLDGGPAGIERALWAARTAAVLRLYSGFLSVGQKARAYLRHFGIPEHRIFDAPHCVDNDRFAAEAAPHRSPAGRSAARAAYGLGERDFVALFVGKLEDNKRAGDLVEAVAHLGPQAALLACGSGPTAAADRALAAARGIRSAWPGFVNQGELARAYAAADCLVLPSRRETWGLAVNEALATGLPCVVSDGVGCAPDLIREGETGFIFPAGDVSALAAALGEVRRRRAAGQDFAPACRARAEACSPEAAAAGLANACRTLASRLPARRPHARPAAPMRVVACFGSMVGYTGLERMSFEVLRCLGERGAQVHCIVNTWSNARIVAAAESQGASWSTGRYWQDLDRHARRPRQLLAIAADIAHTSLGLLADAWRLRATHVLLPEFAVAIRNAPALLLLRAAGVRVILRLGNAPLEGRAHHFFWRFVVDPSVDAFVSNSEFIARALAAHGIAASKCQVIANTPATRAPDAAPPPPRDPTRVVYVGQIIPEKGVDLLVEAVASLVAAGRDVHLDVVGEIDGWEAPAYLGYRDRLRALAARPTLDGRVRFLGWRDDVPRVLAAAAVHCCPSRPEQREGFAGVVVEAKQAGIPSVVAPTGALPELVEHDVDGWVCAAPTAEALAAGLDRFLADPDRARRAGEAARASLARYGRDRFSAAWWAVFAGDGPT